MADLFEIFAVYNIITYSYSDKYTEKEKEQKLKKRKLEGHKRPMKGLNAQKKTTHHTQRNFTFTSLEELFSHPEYEKFTAITIRPKQDKENSFQPPNYDVVYFNPMERLIFTRELPPGLRKLVCVGDVRILPELPQTLSELFCQHCNLMELPKLPESLMILDVSHNNLEGPIHLTPKLFKVILSHNKITKITGLENVTQLMGLIVSNNPISELPMIYNELSYLDISHTNITNVKFHPRFLGIEKDEKLVWEDRDDETKEEQKQRRQGNYDAYECFTLWYVNNPLGKDIYENFNGNPIPDPKQYYDPVCDTWYCDHPSLTKYFNHKRKEPFHKFATKIQRWFLKCKYDPEYVYCRKFVKKMYDGDYDEASAEVDS